MKLDTKVKAVAMKEARFTRDLEMKDKRISMLMERTKTLQEDKSAALKETAVTREKLRQMEAERDRLVEITETLQAEKESLMVDVSV